LPRGLRRSRDDNDACRRLLDRAVTAAREAGDDWQLTHQLRRRIDHYSPTSDDLDLPTADLAECGRLALRLGERGIIETLSVSVHLLMALGRTQLAGATRSCIALWATTGGGVPYGYIAEVLTNSLQLVDEYLDDGPLPETPRAQLRLVLQEVASLPPRRTT
jgi:hypothetical protein